MAITGWREFPAFVGRDGPLRPGIRAGGGRPAACVGRSSLALERVGFDQLRRRLAAAADQSSYRNMPSAPSPRI